MHMKQTIVVNKELNMSPGKLSAQVSHASMAFLTTMIQQGTNKILINGVHRYPCYTPDGKEQLYKRDDAEHCAQGDHQRAFHHGTGAVAGRMHKQMPRFLKYTKTRKKGAPQTNVSYKIRQRTTKIMEYTHAYILISKTKTLI